MVIADSSGQISRYPIPGGKVFPPEDMDLITTLNASPSTSGSLTLGKASITSIVMDDLNVEGMLGTAEGNIHYINF